MEDTRTLIVIIIIVILCVLYYTYSQEDFATRRDKADAVKSWYQSGGNGYESFRKNVTGNIVEYDNVKKLLSKDKSPTVDKIEKILT